MAGSILNASGQELQSKISHRLEWLRCTDRRESGPTTVSLLAPTGATVNRPATGLTDFDVDRGRQRWIHFGTCGKLDVLASRREDGAGSRSAADHRALRRAGAAAENAADGRADACAGADLRGVLALCRFAFERDRIRPQRLTPPVDDNGREPQAKPRPALHASRAIDLADFAVHHRAGWQDGFTVHRHGAPQPGTDWHFDLRGRARDSGGQFERQSGADRDRHNPDNWCRTGSRRSRGTRRFGIESISRTRGGSRWWSRARPAGSAHR